MFRAHLYCAGGQSGDSPSGKELPIYHHASIRHDAPIEVGRIQAQRLVDDAIEDRKGGQFVHLDVRHGVWERLKKFLTEEVVVRPVCKDTVN